MPAPHVVSVILNTNRREDTLACLASLAQNAYRPHTVLVVDNASNDGSAEAIRAAHPDTHLVALAENLGYAGNNNVGIDWAIQHGADWVLVLNEDTVLAPDCVARLVETGQSDAQIGIVGPMIYHFDEPDVIQTAGGVLGPYWLADLMARNERDRGQYREPHSVEWISGCAMLVRRAVIERVGRLDERFFTYWEEIDWCLRASRAGWRLMHVPLAKLWHKGVQRDYRPKPSVTYYTTRNRFLFLEKNHAPLRIWLFSAITTLRTLSSWTLKPKWRHMRADRDAMVMGVWDFARRRWGMRTP
jgi:GT2 family glycosyltransferase